MTRSQTKKEGEKKDVVDAAREGPPGDVDNVPRQVVKGGKSRRVPGDIRKVPARKKKGGNAGGGVPLRSQTGTLSLRTQNK